jgi:adenosylcobyric acid synthase
MKAISVLGTSSNSGKSWLATRSAHGCAAKAKGRAVQGAEHVQQLLRTLDGGEIGRAQAAQAEACGLLPTVEMNPILLKPSGLAGSQFVVLGRAQRHVKAAEY